jgi:hypothetical protein
MDEDLVLRLLTSGAARLIMLHCEKRLSQVSGPDMRKVHVDDAKYAVSC